MPKVPFQAGASGAHSPPAEQAALWADVRAGDARARERLIESHLPYARSVAAKIYAARVDHDLEFDEYMQFGTIGLIEAVDRFRAERDILFKTFATHRITGAILSGIESLSEKRTQIGTRHRLRAERRDSAKTALDDSGKDLFQQLAEMAIGLALGYILDNPVTYQHEESIIPSNQYTGVEMQQLRGKVHALVERLPQRERMVIKCHYLNQTTFSVIAETMGISRGRVSQLHRSGVAMLRDLIKSVQACDVAW